MKLLTRFVASTAAGIGAAFVAALVVALIDLYLTGHGYGSITREVITWDPAGVRMSIGDVVMLLAVIGTAGSTWYLTGHGA